MISKISSNVKFQLKLDTTTGSVSNIKTARVAKHKSQRPMEGRPEWLQHSPGISLQYPSTETTGWEPLLKSFKAVLSIYPDTPQR